MKKQVKDFFNIKKYSVQRKWTLSIFITIYSLAIIFLILTSWFTIDRALSDWFGGAMFKTHGGFNKFIRGWATYFDYEPYRQPKILVAVSVFIVVETISKNIIKKWNKSWWARHDWLLFIAEIAIALVVLYYELKGFYGDYTYHSEFGPWFYIWTMAGKDILLPSYIITCVVMTSLLLSLTWYVHFQLASRDDFASGNYWKFAILNSVFFLVINYEYINGLKFTFNRKYEVNYKFGDWINRVQELYPQRKEYWEEYLHGDLNWGAPLGLMPEKNMNYPDYISAPWWSPLPKGTGGDAFPSGHMNCVLFFCITLFTLFKNPKTRGQKITSRVMTAVGTLYLMNMGLILEYSWSHWMSDMSFTLVTVPVLYAIWWCIFNGFVYLSIYKPYELIKTKYIKNRKAKM